LCRYAEVSSGCQLDARSSLDDLSSIGKGAVACDVNADEVMAGWKYQTDGCAEGERRLVAHCCAVDTTRNATDAAIEIVEATATPVSHYLLDGKAATAARAFSSKFSPPEGTRGVAVDGFVVQRGGGLCKLSAFP
jgi:hypothetical protein